MVFWAMLDGEIINHCTQWTGVEEERVCLQDEQNVNKSPGLSNRTVLMIHVRLNPEDKAASTTVLFIFVRYLVDL